MKKKIDDWNIHPDLDDGSCMPKRKPHHYHD
jgi:hypothetical protein